MLRGARSHARAAFAALERGDLDLFRTLHSATRDLLLDAERRQSDVLAEEAVEAEREIRWRGPRRAAETAHKARAELDADAWEAAQELRRQAPRRGGRLNVAKLAEIISSNDPRLGTPETIEKRLRRSARSQGFDLDEWADRGT
jgi:hypothetical protein